MTYLDFDLLIERTPDHYRARVVNAPAGQATVDFSLPFSPQEIADFLVLFGSARQDGRHLKSAPAKRALKADTAKNFGSRLFEAVFAGKVQECWRRSLDEAGRQEKGLRLRLRLAEVPELAELSWEYLYDISLKRFCALSAETPILRYLDLLQLIEPLAVQPPLKILVMISSPINHPQLDVEREWHQLNKALRDLKRRRLVSLERMDEATLPVLQQRLRQEQFHIFHFIGHGGFDAAKNDGMLIFEDEDERGRPVSGQDLGMLLRDHKPLRLAILNACEGARSSRADPFAGTAQSLVQQGIPAVIAMQFEVSDEAALTFAHQFYSALADQYPVDAAVAEARKAISGQGDNNMEWGTPVLYMRAPDGHIFDVERKQNEETSSGFFSTPKGKKIALAGRVLSAVIMLAVPFYLHNQRPAQPIELRLAATDLKLDLSYQEPGGIQNSGVTMLEGKTLDTRSVQAYAFKPFAFKAKLENAETTSLYQVDAHGNDQADVTLSAVKGLFSVVSLRYRGFTQLTITGSKLAPAFQFQPDSETDSTWGVFAEISLPDTFQIETAACAVYPLSAPENSQLATDLSDKKFVTTLSSFNLNLANRQDQLKLRFANENIANQNLFTELDIHDLQAVRFDPEKRDDVPALLDGAYKFRTADDTTSHGIPGQSTLSFKADSLRLIGLKVRGDTLSAKAAGSFTSFKICQLGNCAEAIPSQMQKILNWKYGYFLAGIYFLLFIRIALGARAYRFLTDLVQRSPDK